MEVFWTFVVGVIFGFSTAVATIEMYSKNERSIYNIYTTAKKQCELTLPRNQECEITFIPRLEIDKNEP